MRFTAIFLLTAILVNVAFSYTAKELDTLQQYLAELGSGINTFTADLVPFSGRGGTISQISQLESDSVSFSNLVAQGVKLIENIQVDGEESQVLVISTLASYYYTTARNAVNGFIDGKSTFD